MALEKVRSGGRYRACGGGHGYAAPGVPGRRERLWLGSYIAPDAAAFAHDSAAVQRVPSNVDMDANTQSAQSSPPP